MPSTPAPSITAQAVDPASTFRRRVGAASIVGFFLALLGSSLVDPTDSHRNADQLRVAIGHAGAMQAAAWFEVAAGILAPVAVLTMVHVVRDRGSRLAHAGAALGILGAPGMALIGIHRMFIVALAQGGGGSATAVLNRLDHLAPAIGVLFFALPLAFVVLAGAVVRARLVPAAVLAAAIVFFLLDSVPLPGGEVIQQVLGLATFGWIAVRIYSMTDEGGNGLREPSGAARPAAAGVTTPATT